MIEFVHSPDRRLFKDWGVSFRELSKKCLSVAL